MKQIKATTVVINVLRVNEMHNLFFVGPTLFQVCVPSIRSYHYLLSIPLADETFLNALATIQGRVWLFFTSYGNQSKKNKITIACYTVQSQKTVAAHLKLLPFNFANSIFCRK